MALAVAACGSSAQSPAAGAAGSTSPADPQAVGAVQPGSSGAPSGPVASTGNVALDLQAAFVSVVNKVSPSVVVVETSEGLGSGVVFDTAGNIVTNAHVVGTPPPSRSPRRRARLAGDARRRVRARRPGRHPDSGAPLPPGDVRRLVTPSVGDITMAIGNPSDCRAASPRASSAQRADGREPGGAVLPDVIQTSAPINPGNSGGALVSLTGEVIGIPTLAATDPQIGGAAPGIGFAVSSNTAKDIATQLIEHGKVVSSHRAYLGIRAANLTGAPGVLVFSVDPGGPAAKAGIPSDVLITSIDGKATPDQPSLATVLAGLTPGQTVPVVLERQDGSTQTVHVTLGELPG